MTAQRNHRMPVYEWAWYEGVEYFCIPNLEESRQQGRTMMDLCYCATAAMNGLVEKTVPFDPERLVVR